MWVVKLRISVSTFPQAIRLQCQGSVGDASRWRVPKLVNGLTISRTYFNGIGLWLACVATLTGAYSSLAEGGGDNPGTLKLNVVCSLEC
jgi:hypothetical protein